MKISLRDVVTLDFETYYGTGYTLASTKMNMSEYIRHELFKIHCVGIKIGKNKTRWYPTDKVEAALRSIDWSTKYLLCHNTQFDGLILSHHFGIVPKAYLDTLGMARALHPRDMKLDLNTLARAHGLAGKIRKQALVDTRNKRDLTKQEMEALGAYCADDVEDTFTLFCKFLGHFPEDELELLHITTAMFCDPVLMVDHSKTDREIRQEKQNNQEALAKSKATPEALMSNPKFAALLKKAGVEPPMKISPRTGKLTYAFSKNDLEFKELANHPKKRVRDLVAARLVLKSTIKLTRAVRLAEAGKDNLPLPVSLLYCGAHTTRWSGGNKLNLQNLNRPVIGDDGEIIDGTGLLRQAIIAPPGYVIGVADSAQIEARILAWLADQMDIVHAFAEKEDVYKLMASQIYGVPVDQITKAQRFVGKVAVLGLGYGMGPAKFKNTLELGVMGPPMFLTDEEASRIVQQYRSANWAIKRFWKTAERIIISMMSGHSGSFKMIDYGKNFIRLPNGLFIQYPGLNATVAERRDELVLADAYYMSRTGPTKIYGGSLTENIVQALARCVIGEQILKVHRAGHRVVSMSHDEIITVLPEKTADKDIAEILSIMSTPPKWAESLPLAAEGGYAKEYSK